MKNLFVMSLIALFVVFGNSQVQTVSAKTNEYSLDIYDNVPTGDNDKKCCDNPKNCNKSCCKSGTKCDKSKCDPSKCHQKDKNTNCHSSSKAGSCCQKANTDIKKCCNSDKQKEVVPMK